MNEKTLSKIKEAYRKNIPDAPDEPGKMMAITMALVHGEQLKLKPAEQVRDAAKYKMAGSSYSNYRSLEFNDIFEPPTSFVREHADWKKRIEAHNSLVAEYKKLAKPLLRKAELNPNADAEEIVAALDAAAEKVFGAR